MNKMDKCCDSKLRLKELRQKAILAFPTEHGASGICVTHGPNAVGWNGDKTPPPCSLCVREELERTKQELQELKKMLKPKTSAWRVCTTESMIGSERGRSASQDR